MNQWTGIGNLTANPEMRTTPNGISVCTFTIAVNDKHKKDAPAQFFRVSAWRGLADNCAKYLQKGSKVAVTGQITLNQYKRNDGQMGASLEVNASEVEFLNSRNDNASGQTFGETAQSSYTDVTSTMTDDELPF